MSESEAHQGLQVERTVLAWWRTGLAAAVAGALVVRQALQAAAHAVFVVVATAALAVLIGVIVPRIIVLQRRAGDPTAPETRAMALFVAATLTLQVVAVILVLR